ncbi:hypothetical protein O9G_004007 [Rozella allomycis CSF55]|uniref:Uncharacterized protein n=1 Tax=Rozella allomycis (strain CSF55) TaxID=988480 RepID=A0A075B1C7_ROZAC|nr:hypothetical protein O9G_004007 [Rozella allomycis CSF55]|eukprot:EPZ36348.1 hypothetical protein O9G_004007 [Rozella allomycis CSF55]
MERFTKGIEKVKEYFKVIKEGGNVIPLIGEKNGEQNQATTAMTQEAMYESALLHETKLFEIVQHYLIKDSHIINLVMNIIQNEREPVELKIEALNVLVVLVRIGNLVPAYLVEEVQVIEVLVDLLDYPNQMVKKLIVYIFIFLAMKNPQWFDEAKVNEMKGYDWKRWDHNEAAEFEKMLLN